MKTRFPAPGMSSPRSRRRSTSVFRLESLEPRYVLTDVGGTIAADTVWELSGAPYNVLSDITVQSDATLSIREGVVVNFANNTGISVNGRLEAEGSAFDRITFQPAAGASRWDGISFNNTLADNRITYADMHAGDAQGEAILVQFSRLTLDNIVWTGTTGTILELEHPSIVVRNSHFPASPGGSEIVHGEYIENDEYLIIEGNIFENSNNGGDVIDILGADRPGPVMQILNNVFKGGGDDGLDLDGTDAHIEGNLFMNFNKNTSRATTSNAIATGLPQTGETNRTQITVVRNIFLNSDHAILLKEDAFATIHNNTFIGMGEAVIQFNEIGGTAVNGPGMGAEIIGNIFHNNAQLFQNLVDDGTFMTQLTLNQNLIPNDVVNFDGTLINAHDLGTGNIAGNPLFVNEASGNYHLQPGSPAVGAAPLGIDMGAYAPGGPAIAGIPTTPATDNDLMFDVGGPGITHYRYRINEGPYGAITPVSQPIVLADMANGDYDLDVIGMNSAGEWFAGQTPAFGESNTEFIAPTKTRTGDLLPIVMRVRDSHGNINSLLMTPAQLANASQLGSVDVEVKKGVGSFSPAVTATSDFTLQMGGSLAGASGRDVDVLDASYPVQNYTGTLTGNIVWDATTERRITGNLTVPAGSTLTIEAGTRVMFGNRLNMTIEGELNILGTAADPVLFSSLNAAQPWGGLELENATASISYAFFNNGGADTTRTFGHSNSQPVIWVADSNLTFDNSFVINNIGKAFGSADSEITIHQSVISDVDTGAQFDRSVVEVTETWLKNIPNGSPEFQDDDNDGFYFAGVHSSGQPSLFQDSFIVTTKDDGLDQNGARLRVVRAWIEGADHEGIASSNTNWVTVEDSVFMRNNQGNEAGYGGPDLTVTNSVLFNNDNNVDTASPVTAGLRFGDGYNGSNGSYTGHITAMNNVIHDNGDNVRNFDGEIGAPQPGAIDITFSMTNDPDYDSDPGNFSGIPHFGPFMHLLRGSAGLGAGSDGESVGRLLPPLRNSFSVASTEPLVRLNEVLASSSVDPDQIELLNVGGGAIDLSGMSLSNDPALPTKYVIPAGTTLGAGQYLVFTASTLGFQLDGTGDQVRLYDTATAGGALIDSVEFGTQLTGKSIGRLADGSWHLAEPSFGAVNVASPTAAAATMRINEWLAVGGGDNPDDFIELYNTQSLPVDFGGLHLTNAPQTELDRFQFTPLSFLDGEGLLLLIADGNTAAGADHLNFTLDITGAIALSGPQLAVIDRIDYGVQSVGISQGRRPNGGDLIDFFDAPTPGADNPGDPNQPIITELVAIDSVWKYEQSGSNLGTAWRIPSYNDSAWPTGPGLLYVEDSSLPGPTNTELDLDADGDGNQTITYYFRHEFEYTGEVDGAILELATIIDDGAVIYLNGIEVYRQNMAAGAVGYLTTADSTVGNATQSAFESISAANLVQGTNVLAVEVHQVDSGSSDIVFGMVLNSIEIQDSTPPSAPGSLQAIAVANDQVDLSWTPGVDPQSGIQLYRIYRGGVEIGTTTGTTFSDMTVSAGNTYTYEVSAVNNKNLEGPRSLPAVVNVVNIVMFQNGAFPNASYSGTDDTWIQGDTATGNFGSDPRMDADGDSGGFGEWSLIRWDVSSVASGTTVESAIVTLTVNNASIDNYDLYALRTDWSESQATWNVARTGVSWASPGTGAADRGALVGTLSARNTGTFDVVLNAAGIALVQSWVDNPSQNFGVILWGDSRTDGIEMRTSEYSVVGDRPKLSIGLQTADTAAPEVTVSAASLEQSPQRIQFQFNEPVQIGAGALQITNLTTSTTVSPAVLEFTYDSDLSIATWTVDGLPRNLFADGNYEATLDASAIQDLAGNPLAAGASNTLQFAWFLGDATADGVVDASDIDALCGLMSASDSNPRHDLTGDGVVDEADITMLVSDVLGTYFGDADLNGTVDATDFGIWQANRFQADRGWATGDFNCDGLVDGSDFNIWNANKFLGQNGATAGAASHTPRAAASANSNHRVVPAELLKNTELRSTSQRLISKERRGLAGESTPRIDAVIASVAYDRLRLDRVSGQLGSSTSGRNMVEANDVERLSSAGDSTVDAVWSDWGQGL